MHLPWYWWVWGIAALFGARYLYRRDKFVALALAAFYGGGMLIALYLELFRE